MYLYLQKDEFQMYSIYCANKPRSEELHNLVGNNNPFFKVRNKMVNLCILQLPASNTVESIAIYCLL